MSSLKHLETRNALVNWQVAPEEALIVNSDKYKIEYRQNVENLISKISKKSLKKKTFVTICTNVLCAEIETSKDSIDPIDRDIYLPLEIAITKWSVAEAWKPEKERTYTKHFWMINPGSPPTGCRNHAREQKEKFHLIEFDKIDKLRDSYFETDLTKVMKEINAILTPDRIVFSQSLLHCRQDLGCLKWLNRETGYKTKPISVYSIEDLYVVLNRNLTDDKSVQDSICLGVAQHRLKSYDTYDSALQCDYHIDTVKEDSSLECNCCAKAVATAYTIVILNDVSWFSALCEQSSDIPDKTGESSN